MTNRLDGKAAFIAAAAPAVGEASARIMAELRLDGRVAIVTAAAQGIGEASARVMAQLGATVVLADINEVGAKEAAERINAAGGRASHAVVDVKNKESVVALIRNTHKTYGRLDILHNNAGGTYLDRDKQVTDITDQVWREIFAWNMDSTHWATQAALPLMIEGGGGAIVNTVSGAATHGMSTETAYGAAKGALASYTRYVAVQYGWRNVRCNSVSPGLILTPHAIAVMAPEFVNELTKSMTTVRAGIPEDIAYAAAFLASDAAGYINGQFLSVNSGGNIRGGNDATIAANGWYGPGIPARTTPPEMRMPSRAHGAAGNAQPE